MSRLLIVDDDPNTLAGLHELLRNEGYMVHVATRAKEAFDLIALEPIDMVLCDYCLPDLDGLQVCRLLKQRRSDLLLFLFTAYQNTELVNAAQRCGIAQIIHKPVILEELFAALAAMAVPVTTRSHHRILQSAIPSLSGQAPG